MNVNLRILLVEDSKTDTILIKKSLVENQSDSYELKAVETLTQALAHIAEEKFDAVLLDVSLPDTSGLNGLHSLQNKAPRIPVIMLTAHADEALALEAMHCGAQDYLFKDKVSGSAIKRAIQYAIQRKRFENVLITQAHYDAITGLPNRVLFESRLDLALARHKRMGEGVSVFFMDLDRFKQVNDSMGHSTGDQLLKQVAERLTQSVRPYDTVARFGGDEFALIVEGAGHSGQCATIAQKIIKKIELPFIVAGNEITIGVSIGIAMCSADNELARDAIVKQADAAMYSAKANAHSDFHFHAPETYDTFSAKN